MSDFFLILERGEKAWPNAFSLRDECMILKKNLNLIKIFESSDVGDPFLKKKKKMDKACLNAPIFFSEKQSHNKPKKHPKTQNRDYWGSVELGANQHSWSAD